eukprot:UN24786
MLFFGACLSLQKIKFMLFELFQACKKLNSCSLRFLSLQKIKHLHNTINCQTVAAFLF